MAAGLHLLSAYFRCIRKGKQQWRESSSAWRESSNFYMFFFRLCLYFGQQQSKQKESGISLSTRGAALHLSHVWLEIIIIKYIFKGLFFKHGGRMMEMLNQRGQTGRYVGENFDVFGLTSSPSLWLHPHGPDEMRLKLQWVHSGGIRINCNVIFNSLCLRFQIRSELSKTEGKQKEADGWGKWKLCLVYSLFHRIWAGPGWQLVNRSDRRDKIWRWQLFLLHSVFYNSVSLSFRHLCAHHSLTFHRHHASPVCQAQNRREEEKKKITSPSTPTTTSSMCWFQVTVITVY